MGPIGFADQVVVVTGAGRGLGRCGGERPRKLGEGWVASGGEPSAEDVAANLAEIAMTDPYTIPESIYDEVFGVCDRSGIGGAAGL